MAGQRSRLMAGLLACSGVLAVAACQATAVPSPFTQSAEPSVSPTAVVVPPVSPSAPASVTSARATSPAVTRPAKTERPQPSSSLGPLRLNYRGITKLVVVKSVLNDTPAGRAAIDAIARYNGALATATQDRTVEPARRATSVDCKPCQSDVNRIAAYIGRHERIVPVDGLPSAWISIGLFIQTISASGRVTVDFDGQQPGVKLVRSNGSTVATDSSSSSISDTLIVQFSHGRATIIDLQARS